MACISGRKEALSSSTFVTPKEASSSRPLSLPTELRLAIYEHILPAPTFGLRVLDLDYHPSEENWPSNDFTGYRNLLLNNKQTHAEVEDAWFNQVPPSICAHSNSRVPPASNASRTQSNGAATFIAHTATFCGPSSTATMLCTFIASTTT